LLLKSHTSNYSIVGFTSVPTRQDLSRLARDTGTLLLEDLGSGVLIDLSDHGLGQEPVVRDVLAAGVDLVTFSGDKLLGGPQAGIIAGRRALVETIKRHPMARAVRIDKLSLAALRATLELYRPPCDPLARVPVLRMMSEPLEQVEARARRVIDALQTQATLAADLVTSTARAGAGSLPNQDLPSFAVSVSHHERSAEQLAAALRAADAPVIGRITKDRLLLDMRTVDDDEIAALCAALSAI